MIIVVMKALKVNDNHEKKEWTHHVHRVYLASGPRKSGYFETFFSLANDTEETARRTSTLELPESACQIFPRFLDYICASDESTSPSTIVDSLFFSAVSARESVALVFLAGHFRVPKLTLPLTHRLRSLTNDKNVHQICREAMLYKSIGSSMIASPSLLDFPVICIHRRWIKHYRRTRRCRNPFPPSRRLWKCCL